MKTTTLVKLAKTPGATIAVAAFATLSHATDGVWNSVPATEVNWSDTAQWLNGDVADGIGATAIINTNIGGAKVINIDSNITLGTLNIGDTNTTHTWTLAATNGSVLTLDNGGSGVHINQLSTSKGDTLSTNITLADNLILSNAANYSNTSDRRDLTLSGSITGTHALTIDSTGTGAVRLSGVNSFSAVTIKNGTFGVNQKASLGDGVITIGDAAAGPTAEAKLALYGSNGSFSATANAIHVVGAGANILEHTAWAADFTGAVTLDQNLILRITGTSTNALTLSGTITGTGGLTVDTPWGSPNVVNIYGKGSTYAGGLTVKAGRATVRYIDGLGTGDVTIGHISNTGDTNAMLTVGGTNEGFTATNAIHVRGGGVNTVRTTAWSAILQGSITLHDSNLTINANSTSGTTTTVEGSIVGTGDLTLSTVGHATSTAASSTRVFINGSINHTGSITSTSTGVQANRGTYIAGSIGANVTDITQTGAESRLTLTGADNAFTGDVKIEGGSLTLGSGTSTTLATFLTDTTSLYLYTTDNSALILNFKDATVIESIAGLYIDDMKQADGLWGAPGSIAAGTADHETALITGAGLLQVGSAVPEPATIALFAGFLALAASAACRRFRHRK
ncbi:MAG: PEP-CTERM sorting domain-containing protein [Opitutaceae bacterium]|jgi:autotransporter-associated beta strand protein|nr:PEP-CTERM sorting domain-containing protein [Opitutaceae bacterium]